MTRGKGGPARTRRRGVLYRPLSIVLILAAVLFSFSVFFKTLHIEVEVMGAGRYSEQEIVEASGVQTGKNLFLVDKDKAIQNILDTMPYVQSVQICRKLPSTLEITVVESPAVAYIPQGSSYWLLSPACKVLEQTDEAGAQGLIWVKGLEPEQLEVGKSLSVPDEESGRLEYLSSVLQILTEKGMNEEVSALDISNAANLRFYYEERFVVKLGQLEDLENKMELLKGVAAQKNPAEKGTIDLSYGKEAHYIPNS